MFKTLTAGDFSLETDEVFVLPDARDVLLACSAGVLWVTLDGDRRDYVLNGGESLAIASNALVVIDALQPSRLTVRLRKQAAPRRRHAPHERAARLT